MDLQLKGKIALLTGASRGLGYATALVLAQEGASLAICSRNEASVMDAAKKIHDLTGAMVLPIVADVSDHQAANRLVDLTVAKFGGLDILITNAGGPPSGNFTGFDDAVWQSAVETSFLGHVRLIRAALPWLQQSSAPAVLTITSSAVKSPINDLILSNSIRAATAALTKSLSIELGAIGIRFNSILPGWTETDRIKYLLESRAKTNGTTVEDEKRKQSENIPLKRIGQPEEFARAAAFLVSPAASYITGVLLPVDGGAIRGY